MPLAPYTVLTAIGSAIWAFAIAGAGYGLGSSYRRFDHGFKYAEYVVLAGVLLFAAYLVYRWVDRARVNRRADPTG
jgi:membrane protein DedA with SNARE-associated domain